jgi:RNA polymerase sigma-70 factor (ECF subfamily)
MDDDRPTPQTIDQDFFLRIYDEFFDRIYNYVYFRCFEAELSDDLTARIFERALLKIDQYNPHIGSPAPWLFAIARNTLTDYWRRSRRFRWIPLDSLKLPAARENEPEARLAADEETRALLHAVGRLEERERDILGLKFVGRLNNRQIARATGLGENHIAVIVYRAVRKLRTELTEGES